MFIERDGKRIYLTEEELSNASMEFDHECNEYAVDWAIDPAKFGITEEEYRKLRKDIVKEYGRLVEKDSRWSGFVVEAARKVIDEYKKEATDA